MVSEAKELHSLHHWSLFLQLVQDETGAGPSVSTKTLVQTPRGAQTSARGDSGGGQGEHHPQLLLVPLREHPHMLFL